MIETRKLQIEYYGNSDEKGVRKFKIYTISICAEGYPELKLNFMYLPMTEDLIKILSDSIYPTLAVGADLRPWQNACIEIVETYGLPKIDDNTMSSSAHGITIELLHAYIK